MRSKPRKSKLEIVIQCATPSIESNLTKTISLALIKKWVQTGIHCGGLITLRFVNASEGKKLNSVFRKKDYATNVLTFPYEHTNDTVIADIIFCLPVIQKEARDQNKSLKAHLAHLIIHGCLHAQGHDHEIAKEAKKMESLEIQLLEILGFTNPYQ